MFERLGFADAVEQRALNFSDQQIDALENLLVGTLPVKDSPPKRGRRRRASLKQVPFLAATFS